MRAAGFVALAVVLVLIGQALLHRGDDAGAPAVPRIVGAGAAPERSAPTSQARVSGTKAGAQAVAAGATGATGAALTPLAEGAFAAPIARYRSYARGEARVLAARVDALRDALSSGDRARSRTAWAAADSAWRRVGAAYGALGSLGDAIATDGLSQIADGLWGDAAPRSLAPVATALRHDVGRLRATLASSEITSLDYATRAHEILEDVQRDDFGAGDRSGSAVRATADGVAATDVVLDTLAGVLAGRGDALTQSRFWTARLSATLAAIRRAHGRGASYPAFGALSHAERQRLLGGLAAALEALRGIPDELETTLPPKRARIPKP